MLALSFDNRAYDLFGLKRQTTFFKKAQLIK